MSSQVPSGYGGSLSDIAFESNYPYSLHPTAVDGSIDVGDTAEYDYRGIVVYAGGSYSRPLSYNGPLAFLAYYELLYDDTDLGSSGYIHP